MKLPKQIRIPTLIAILAGVLLIALVVALAVTGSLPSIARALTGAAFGRATNLIIPPSPSTTASAEFGKYNTAYPNGAGYDTFVDTLDNLPAIGGDTYLRDVDGDGSLANERCNENAIGSLWIAQETLAVARIAEEAIASSILEPTNAGAFLIWAVNSEAELATKIIADQCGFQDSLVDSAEIEAAYENTETIIDQLNHSVELREVHMQVIEIKERTEFLVVTTEAGVPVEVSFTGVQVASRNDPTFVDVFANSTITPNGDGLYLVEIDLPRGIGSAELFVFEVRHDDIQVNHFGFTVFDRGPE